MKQFTAAQYQAAALNWMGEVWRPDFRVEHVAQPEREDDTIGWYWRDHNSDDGPQGPFKSERAAWKAICELYGLEPESAPIAPAKAPVLVIVSGGVADYVETAGSDTRIMDLDNIEAGDPPCVLPRGVGFEELLAPLDYKEGRDYTWEAA